MKTKKLYVSKMIHNIIDAPFTFWLLDFQLILSAKNPLYTSSAQGSRTAIVNKTKSLTSMDFPSSGELKNK